MSRYMIFLSVFSIINPIFCMEDEQESVSILGKILEARVGIAERKINKFALITIFSFDGKGFLDKGDIRSLEASDLEEIIKGNFIYCPLYNTSATTFCNTTHEPKGAIIIGGKDSVLIKELLAATIRSFITPNRKDIYSSPNEEAYSLFSNIQKFKKLSNIKFWQDLSQKLQSYRGLFLVLLCVTEKNLSEPKNETYSKSILIVTPWGAIKTHPYLNNTREVEGLFYCLSNGSAGLLYSQYKELLKKLRYRFHVNCNEENSNSRSTEKIVSYVHRICEIDSVPLEKPLEKERRLYRQESEANSIWNALEKRYKSEQSENS